MAQTRSPPAKEYCCDFSKDLPDTIQKELEKQGGVEGLLARIPDASALHASSRLYQALAAIRGTEDLSVDRYDVGDAEIGRAHV